jgi:DNA-binding transcriptional LysR family regulator
VSTSALSQSVRQLEVRLGVTLLTRTSRTVALTDAGQRLLETAGAAVDQALESLKTVSAQPGEVTGRVRLSVPTVAVTLVVARLLPRFIERHPKVEVEVQSENRFVNIVAEGLDAGIRLSEAIERDMVQVRLTEPGRFVVAAAPSSRLIHGELTKEETRHHGTRGRTVLSRHRNHAPGGASWVKTLAGSPQSSTGHFGSSPGPSV